jgi:rhodanese-related sulfurtransferase
MSKKPTAGETARNILWLISAALILAVAVNLISPKRIPWTEDWSARVEARAVEEGVALAQLADMIDFLRDGSRLIVDVRPAADYALGHIPGAVSLPHTATLPEWLSNPALPVVFYGSGPDDENALELARVVRRAALFIGGMERWQAELLEAEEGGAAQ